LAGPFVINCILSILIKKSTNKAPATFEAVLIVNQKEVVSANMLMK
jgi:hypothetical protein